MLFKSVETCHPVSLPCKVTSILIFLTCGASFYLRGDLYNQDKISIPMGAIYLHARMFCALAHTSPIPIGEINFYMQEHFFTVT